MTDSVSGVHRLIDCLDHRSIRWNAKIAEPSKLSKMVKIISEAGIDMITELILSTALGEKDMLKREEKLGNCN